MIGKIIQYLLLWGDTYSFECCHFDDGFEFAITSLLNYMGYKLIITKNCPYLGIKLFQNDNIIFEISFNVYLVYDKDGCKQLCRFCGLLDEWEKAGKNFEEVLSKAFESLKNM